MKVFGLEGIAPSLQKEAYFIKGICNESGIALFPEATQHRDLKVTGLSYEDDYAGNALALTIVPGSIDIRFHRDFSEDRVSLLVHRLKAIPELDWLSTFAVRYQGRSL